MNWIESLIGKPWRLGARGPEAFDCYGLVVWIYRTQLGKRLDSLESLNVADLASVLRAVESQDRHWRELAKPEHLCLVGMSTHTRIHHVGVWLDFEGGKVLHAMEGGTVVAQKVVSLKSAGFRTFKFYRKA